VKDLFFAELFSVHNADSEMTILAYASLCEIDSPRPQRIFENF